MEHLNQSPHPGARILLHRGSLVEFSLEIPVPIPGNAWLRTNIGHAETRRNEIVRHVEKDEPILERDWHDIPMRQCGERHFQLTLPLLETGRFLAKTFFISQDDPHRQPQWPQGDDVVIKVEPAEYGCAATLYSAFVRQFGENRLHGAEDPAHAAAVELLESHGYEVIPRSGKFRDLVDQLDHIVCELGFRIIQLLPIFPTPTTYARMGRFGSPFAALDLMAVDPALAEFDRRTTPLEQFGELLDETHLRGAKLFLDIPINHTGWASWLQNHHPEWFKRREDTGFESPGAWGVTWADLSELDYSDRGLWRYMADVFLFWCRQGVDGFRCDAGYMIPLPVWEYITAKVRLQYPDTIFFLEGLGGKKSVVLDLLDRANLNWAYSELFQNYTRHDVEAILTESIQVSAAQGMQVHFAETHDNNRLAAISYTYARMRTQLAALCSHSGGFGITCGVEWYAAVSIEVHRAHPLHWHREANQIFEIRRLNALLSLHPAFWAGAELTLIPHHSAQVLALQRRTADGETVLVLVNLDANAPAEISWKATEFAPGESWDLLTSEAVEIAGENQDGGSGSLMMAPGEARCLSRNAAWLAVLDQSINGNGNAGFAEPKQSLAQRQQAKVLELYHVLQRDVRVDLLDIEALTREMCQDPQSFCVGIRDGNGPPPVVHWRWPRDTKRIVMWPPNTVLLVESKDRFLLELRQGDDVLGREPSFPTGEGSHFTLFCSRQPWTDMQEILTLHLSVFAAAGSEHHHGSLLALSNESPMVTMEAGKSDAIRHDLYGLCTNGHGAMVHARGHWGDIRSQYDSLLAANPHDSFPVDRRILLARVRAWLVYRGFSREINADCLHTFSQNAAGELRWTFFLPMGMGKHICFEISVELSFSGNATRLTFHRLSGEGDPDALDDDESVRLIVRPDIEDRGFHEKTKAFSGPENTFPKSLTSLPNGFDFQPPGGCGLQMRTQASAFTHEPEWHYMVSHPIDAGRGLDGSSDLFSPGYFAFDVPGESAVSLDAQVPGHTVEESAFSSTPVAASSLSLKEASKRAIPAYIVKRDHSKTVIAGYPWFLDWGRDTLICLRGMIAAGFLDEAREIARQFARFEKDGTLPNMIRGDDDSNRDTSDAPLWLFAACADLRRADGTDAFLQTDCGGGRSIFEVLRSIAHAYLQGTPNGIRVDPASGLVFSPSHFTWMDTNHPAGTPREGYPIEIQALWHGALTLLDTLEPGSTWHELRERVSASIKSHFWHAERGFLSDCLHATAGQSAVQASPDDHLRPNQLFAITLGAVSDPGVCRAVIRSCEELLIPGAIRSLSDRRVWHRLPITRDGALLNNPTHPYWGHYEGDEDTRRKPAYHNGTAWTWPFPSYAEALALTYGDEAKPMAKAILSSSAELFNQGCLGHLPEVLDGDAPHAQRGCGAQAWAVTELYRVLDLLD